MYANVLRAGTLTDDRVIKTLTSYFVPTHFNNNDPTRPKDHPSAVLWRAIKGQKELQGQGLWVVAPDGTVLDGMSAEINGEPSDRAGKGPGAPWGSNPQFIVAVRAMLDRSLTKFGPVTPRNVKAVPLPYRGAGIKPDGGVRLVVYNRADNGLAFSVLLDKEQWAGFAPPKTAVGTRWDIDEDSAKLFGSVLSPFADTRLRPRVEDVRSAKLNAVVESVAQGRAQIRLTGKWAVNWDHDGNENSKGEATAEGIAVYDLKAKTMSKLVLIFDGTYSYTNRPGQAHLPKPSTALVRWRLEGPAE